MPANTKPQGFSDEEREAMKARARELAAEARIGKNRDLGEQEIMGAIAKMPEPDKSMATRIHEIVKECAPELMPKTWYGMPAYAKDDKVLCFFQAASKFKARYASFGFNDVAKLDSGNMWPVAFALKNITTKEEAQIKELLQKAVG